MALRQLMIGQRMAALRQEREALVAAMEELRTRRTAWEEREARAVAAFGELNENSTDEERAAFETESNEIETERQALEADETANTTRTGEIENELRDLETELEELNKRGKPQQKKPVSPVNHTERGVHTMNQRTEYRARVAEICQADEVRTFLRNFREIKSRGVTNADYTIPTVMLPMIQDATERASKLMKYVNHQRVAGEGTQNILAGVPEAVWTETIGKLNEIELGFNQIRVGGSKLGAFIAVPNAYLEDSDENLAMIIIEYLGRGNGYGIDKAIVYGTGVNMPVGFMTRLAASTQPSWWQNTMPAFTNISAKHIGKVSDAGVTGADLYKEMMAVLGSAKTVYNVTEGGKFWVMNEKTYLSLQSELLSVNAAGAVVTGAARTLPIIGGAVEFLDFVADGTIAGGYGSHYSLAERAGLRISEADQYRFVEDQTVYRAISRWDGIPVAGEAFAAFSINTTAPATSVTFAEDKANKTAE